MLKIPAATSFTAASSENCPSTASSISGMIGMTDDAAPAPMKKIPTHESHTFYGMCKIQEGPTINNEIPISINPI